MINLNKLAVAIAKKEGKKKQVSIAQIKEILKISLKLLGKFKASEIMALIERH